MTIVNNFEVQRFDSCLRAALYENFISHYADKDDAEIITSDRDFIKRSNVKSRNYTKSPTSLKFPVPIYCRYVGSKANLKNRIVTQKINGKTNVCAKKRYWQSLRFDSAAMGESQSRIRKIQWSEGFYNIAFGILSCALKRSEVALFAHFINFAIDYFISYKNSR